MIGAAKKTARPVIKEDTAKTKKTLQQLRAQFADCPSSEAAYSTENKNYAVTRHFTQARELNDVVLELARLRADRDAGFR